MDNQLNRQKNLCKSPTTKARVVPQRTLQNLFQQHGNQFLKWNFLPFLDQKERSVLRTTCTLLKTYIPGPTFVYTKNKHLMPSWRATARLEKNTGYVETKGHSICGGNSSTVAHHLQSNVIQIRSTCCAFAALKKSGEVITWGHHEYGGDSSNVSSELQSGVIQICANRYAFAALKQGGKVVTWGRPAGLHAAAYVCPFSSDLQSGVTSIVATPFAFAALKSNGEVFIWECSPFGGNSSHLNDVIKLEALEFKFRATKSDGSIIQWY